MSLDQKSGSKSFDVSRSIFEMARMCSWPVKRLSLESGRDGRMLVESPPCSYIQSASSAGGDDSFGMAFFVRSRDSQQLCARWDIKVNLMRSM